LNASKEERVALEEDLEALPDNDLLKGEVGKETSIDASQDPRVQLVELAKTKIEAAKNKGKELSVDDAQKQVLDESPELKAAISKSTKFGA
jgi:hypothetical protein